MNSPISNKSSPSNNFSPIRVTESPVTAQKGQLRGTPRTVRDATAELFNNIQEWNRIHLVGMNVINTIIDKKLEQINKAPPECDIYPQGLQEDCNELESVCLELSDVLEKLGHISKNFKAIKKLEEMNRTDTRPIFITWTAEKYVETVEAILTAYRTETEVKQHVKENIGHAHNKENLMLYSCIWAYQPYVDDILDFKLEAMLKETGHR